MDKKDKNTAEDLKEKYSQMSQEQLVDHAVKTDMELEGIHTEYLGTIGELKATIEELKSGASKKVITVEHKKKVYAVTAPSFKYKEKAYKAEDIEAHPDIVAELIKMESSILIEVTE